MKKILIILSAILFINLASYSQNNTKCEKKCDQNSAAKQCSASTETQSKKLFMSTSQGVDKCSKVTATANNKKITSDKTVNNSSKIK